MLPLLALALAAGPEVTFRDPPAEVTVYDPVEFVAEVKNPLALNPFTDATFTVAVTTPRGKKLTVSGFCDSPDGRRFVARFMTTEAGRHEFTPHFHENRQTATGVTGRGVAGTSSHGNTFDAKPAGRKGPIRVDPKHPHHFVWEGTGEHVFVNGTTAYWLLGVQYDARIAAAIDRLAANKINRIRVALNARTPGGERWYEPQVKTTDAFRFHIDPWPNSNPDDAKHPQLDLTKFNVPLWRKLDRQVRHAWEKDVLVSVVFHLDGPDEGVDPFGGGKAALKGYTGSEQEWAYYRYAAARLSAYSNVMWDLTNEWHLFRTQAWVNAAGGVLKAADPYQHLTSVHGRGDYPFYKSDWSDFALYQSWDDAGAYAFLRKVRKFGDAVRPMPHVNEEYGYEDHYPGPWGGGKKAPARAAANRAGLAWDMCFAGGYQTTGERADVPGQGGWITGLGDDSMKLPELHRHLADFFTAFEWWACDPVDGLADNGARVLADADRKTIAVYLPQGNAATVKLPAGSYSVTWFDPRTGVGSKPGDAGGEWMATPPSAEPWAVLLVRK